MRFSVTENRGLKLWAKHWLLPVGRSPRRVRAGLLAGLHMQLDLTHHTQRWLGLQERELYAWLRGLSVDIRSALDVGANDGMYTLYFLARTSASKVFSFEPSTESLAELKENLALNDLSENHRLEIISKKVGSTATGEWITLDSFASRIRPPCLVKVDIDGGEGELLRGAQTLLQARGMRWIVEVHSKSLEQQCLQILKEANYRTVVVPNAWWRHVVPELRPGELNHWLVAFRENPAGAAER
jgi:methyltransferase FkbM-like protein